jgi:phytoene synthase
MIAGVSSDLEPRHVATFEELYEYCYQVASAVGLSIVHIFGFDSDDALPLAEKCGIAFQLTNILRDVREDAQMGRVYLPLEDLERFGVRPQNLAEAAEPTAGFRQLMQFEADRARSYYQESEPLVDGVHPRSRGALWALIRTYRRLLERIESSGFDVLRTRVRVPTWEKMSILCRGTVRR